MRLGGQFRARRTKLAECNDLGFTNHAPGKDARICRGWEGEAPITNRQPTIVEHNWDVEQPGGPEFPPRPSDQRCMSSATAILLNELASNSNHERKRHREQQESPAARIPMLEQAQ